MRFGRGVDGVRLRPHVLGGKGVGSQGDGSVQFLCRGAEDAARCVNVLRDDFGMRDAFVLEVPGTAETKPTETAEGNASPRRWSALVFTYARGGEREVLLCRSRRHFSRSMTQHAVTIRQLAILY